MRIRDIYSGQPLYLRKKRTTKGIRGWSSGQLSLMERRAPAYKTIKKALDLEIVKQTNKMKSGFGEIRKWTLWRGRPPPKWKKKLQIQQETAMYKHWPQ
jgi:hypothetical protein